MGRRISLNALCTKPDGAAAEDVFEVEDESGEAWRGKKIVLALALRMFFLRWRGMRSAGGGDFSVFVLRWD